jgi:hypothetical protein
VDGFKAENKSVSWRKIAITLIIGSMSEIA